MAEIRIKSTHPETQGDFVDIDEGSFDPEIHEIYVDPSAPAATIPEDWASMHWKRRVALARQIAGGDDEITSDKANEIIADGVIARHRLG